MELAKNFLASEKIIFKIYLFAAIFSKKIIISNENQRIRQ